MAETASMARVDEHGAEARFNDQSYTRANEMTEEEVGWQSF
jgi:hypothetical protein